MSRNPNRQNRLICMVWITCFLLQHCREVLLMNVQQMRDKARLPRSSDHAKSKHERFPHRQYSHQKKQSNEDKKGDAHNGQLDDVDLHSRYLSNLWDEQNSSTTLLTGVKTERDEEVRSVVEAVKNVAKKIRIEHGKIQNLHKIACNRNEFKRLQHFWKGQHVVYPLYLISAAVMAELGSCPEEMMNYVQNLVLSLGSKDAIELVEESETIIEYISKRVDDSELENNYLLEPESAEYRHFKQLLYILTDSIDKVHAFSDFLHPQNENDTKEKITNGIDEKTDEAIMEYDIISSLLDSQPEIKRTKRSVGSHIKQSTLLQSSVEDALHFYSSLSKGKMTELHTKALARMDKRTHPNPYNAFSKPPKAILRYLDLNTEQFRKRRSLQEYEHLVFIRNQNFPCKLLTVCGNAFCFKPYDEQSLLNLLWVRQSGFLKHQATDKYIYTDKETGIFSLKDEMPHQELLLSNHHLFFGDNRNCTVFAEKDNGGNINLNIMCHRAAQTWSFVNFNEAKSSIASIACLFFIQDVTTCSVVTLNTNKGKQYLVMKQIDNQNMINQVWQWNNQALLHYNSQKYLTRGFTGTSAEIVTLANKSDEKWSFENNQLKVFDTIDKGILDTTHGKITLSTVGKNRLNLTMADEKDIINCQNNGRHFAIKHTAEPCKVLCPKKELTGPDALFTVVVSGIGFVIGMLAGLFSLNFGERQMAVKIAFAVGVLLSTTTVLVIQYSNLFWEEWHTVEFKDYIDAEPLTCLWHEYTGTLRSLDNNKSLHVEPPTDGVHWIVRLSTDAEQTWLFQNGSLNGFITDYCHLCVRSDTVNPGEHKHDLLFSCKYTIQTNTSWTKVYKLDNFNFRKQVYCMYFLRQTNEQSCTFLTGERNSSTARPQLHSDGNVLNQLWFARGDSLENVGTGSLIGENVSSFEKVPYNEAEEVINILTSCHENMFFIKSETVPCNVLTVTFNNGSFNLALNEYSTEKYFNQIWTKVEGHLYNVGTGTKVFIDSSNSPQNFIISNASFIQYDTWHFENQTITFSSAGCMLSADDLDDQIEITCKNTSHSRWSLVQFDINFTFLNNLLCTFFLQNQNPPCAFLTANATKKLVFLEYMATDVIQDQLWFKSDDRLVNLQSGQSLAVEYGGTEIKLSSNGSLKELKWIHKDSTIIERNTKQLLNGFASVRLTAESQILTNGSQFWKFISSDMIMEHLSLFQCHSSTPQFFFLKNEMNPCELLTANDSKEISFRVFDKNLIEKQLWYIENGRLFNVYTGNVLRFVENATGIFKIELSEMLIFDLKQIMYTLHDKLVHVYNTSHECFLSFVTHNGESRLSCHLSESKETEWKRISYNEEMHNMEELLCLFFVKSKEVPCEYLTGYEEAEVVKARPQINELITSQLFYWKNDYIVHMQTGLLLTASIDRSSDITLETEDTDTEKFFQRWSFLGYQIVPVFYPYFALELDINTDGKIMLAKSYCDNQTARIQHWWQVPYHDVTYNYESETEDGCTDDKSITSNVVFFIRNKENPCLTLTGSDQGTMPYFTVFNLDDIESFLWIYDSHHIMNFKSGLAFMIDYEEGSTEHNVLLWPRYAYSLAQKWTKNKNGLYFSGLNTGCFLNSGTYNGTVMLQSKCKALDSADIEMLKYDEDAEVVNNLTCTFFIKSNADHCELLTGIDGNEIKTRPLITDLIIHQLWYWRGTSLVNYGNNAVIVVSNISHKVMLQNSNSSQHPWSYSNSFLKSRQFQDTFMTISEHSGEIVIATKSQTSSELQQWILIDRDEGINNPASLFCDDFNKNRKLFVVRSEYDSCPLLMKSKDSSIGATKMSNLFSNDFLWLRDKNHILNVDDGRCLSVKESVVRGTSVLLQQRYFYEKLQQWSTANNAIHSMHVNHSQYLTYTGSKVIMENRLADTTDKQRWKWYTVEQIEGNDKLLRCSRCYNKGEETAAEVLSYIPIFGWLYNIGRSIAYGAKKCPEVAISSLVEGTIDVAFDVVVGLSAGTASAFAYGVKTAMKLGVKAGINAAKIALRSMIKQTFKTLKTNILKFVRHGVKKTLRNHITKIRMKPKAAVLIMKQRVVKLKILKDTKIFRFKSFFRKRLELKNALQIKDVSLYRKSFKGTIKKIKSSLTNIPSSIQRQAAVFNKKVKEKLNDLGNLLTERAENAIKKEKGEKLIKNKHDFLHTENSMHTRCKRQDVGCFSSDLKKIKDYHEELPPMSDRDKYYLQQLGDLEIFSPHGQMASACVIKDRKIIKSAKEHIKDLRKTKTKPEYDPLLKQDLQNNGRKDAMQTGRNDASRDIMHAEQSVIKKIEDTVTENCKTVHPCEIILYTKLAPCDKRYPSNAITCLGYIIEKCKTWFERSKTKCVIVFKETYTEPIFTENMEESLAGILGKKTDQNDLTTVLNDVEQFAKQNLDKISTNQPRVTKIYKKLDFSKNQDEVFQQALYKAIQIAKEDIRFFWDTLFGQLDEHIKGFTFANWGFRSEVSRLTSPNKMYYDIVEDEIKELVKKMIRISFNEEAMKRKTVKAIYDMKKAKEAGAWIEFHQIDNS